MRKVVSAVIGFVALSGCKPAPQPRVTAVLRPLTLELNETIERGAEVVRKRVADVRGATVTVRDKTIVVSLPEKPGVDTIVRRLSPRGELSVGTTVERAGVLRAMIREGGVTAATRDELVSTASTAAPLAENERLAFSRTGDGWELRVLDAADVLPLEVRDASASVDEAGGASVSVELTRESGERFGAYTAAHVRRKVALVVDREILSEPMVMERIDGGRLLLTLGAHGSTDQAGALVTVLRAGTLPFDVEVESVTSATGATRPKS